MQAVLLEQDGESNPVVGTVGAAVEATCTRETRGSSQTRRGDEPQRTRQVVQLWWKDGSFLVLR